VLGAMKAKTKGAQQGHKLLKQKADALNMKFRSMAKDIKDRKENLGDVLKEAYWSASAAKHSAGEGVT
jgi:V-type H+-transporting ATPase subunit D